MSCCAEVRIAEVELVMVMRCVMAGNSKLAPAVQIIILDAPNSEMHEFKASEHAGLLQPIL